MPRSTRLVLLIGLYALSSSGCAARQATQPLAPLCSRVAGVRAFGMDHRQVIGEVYSLEGRPLEGVGIYLRSVSSEAFETGVLTDNTGYFEMTGVAPGKYIVTARTIGYYVKSDSIEVHELYKVRLCTVLTEATVPLDY